MAIPKRDRVKLWLSLHPETAAALKAHARERETSVSAVVERLVRGGLKVPDEDGDEEGSNRHEALRIIRKNTGDYGGGRR